MKKFKEFMNEANTHTVHFLRNGMLGNNQDNRSKLNVHAKNDTDAANQLHSEVAHTHPDYRITKIEKIDK